MYIRITLFLIHTNSALTGGVYLLIETLRQDAGGPKVKKPTRLGSLSPSHKESCKDLEPFTSRSPETPPLDPAKDDYRDDKCPGRTCLEAAEELAASPDQLQRESGAGRRSGGRGGSGTPPSGRSPMLQSPSQTSRSPAAADPLFKGGREPAVPRLMCVCLSIGADPVGGPDTHSNLTVGVFCDSDPTKISVK